MAHPYHPYIITITRVGRLPMYRAVLTAFETRYGPWRVSDAAARAAGEALAQRIEQGRWERAQANK